MALRLIIEDDEGTTTVVPLGVDAITIGRQQGNTIQLTEKNVSRRHARLFPEPDEQWFIEDLGSYNGVKVNGAAVEARIELKEGDVVQIGDYHLTLTENADKTAVAPAPTAANDGAGRLDEPLLASSSTDLPRLSTEDLAALQSGPVPIQSMMESGAVPAVAAPGGFEEERKSSTGLLIGAGAVVVGALIVAFAWMAGSGKPDPATTVAAAERPKVTAAEAKTAGTMAQADSGAGLNPGVIEDPQPEAVVEPTADVGEVADRDPDVEAIADPDVEDSSEDPDLGAPDKTKNRNKPRTKPKTDSTPKTPPPPTPDKPSVDVDALLGDAKKASFGNVSQCYDLAKKAYDASRSSTAANLMGVCACKMGDEGKAKKAVSKLRGSSRDNVVQLCATKGIQL